MVDRDPYDVERERRLTTGFFDEHLSFAIAAARLRLDERELERKTPGHVYFICDNERVKIGYSSRVNERLAGHWYRFGPHHVMGVIPGGIPLERRIQGELARYKIEGEIFRMCQEMIVAARYYIERHGGRFHDPNIWMMA